MDSDLQALRDSIRDVLSAEVTSERLHRFADSGELTDAALWTSATELGWPALAVAEAHDGLGLGAHEIAALFEEIGRTLAPLPLFGSVVFARALAASPEPAQTVWAARVAVGDVRATVPVGGPAAPVTVSAARDGDGFILNGAVAWLLDAAGAQVLLAPASLDGATAWFAVDAAAENVTLQVERTWDLTRNLGAAILCDVRLSADALLGAVGEIIETETALAIAADSIGGADVVLAFTVEYLKTRVQFGKPIGSFQALKHRCADHKVALEVTRAVVAEAVARQADGATDARLLATAAKAYAARTYVQIAEDAVQLHGGIGYTWEHDCHLFLKRAKLNQALLGGDAGALDHAALLLAAA